MEPHSNADPGVRATRGRGGRAAFGSHPLRSISSSDALSLQRSTLLGADPSRPFGWTSLTRKRPISDALCRFRGTPVSAPCRPAAASGACALTRFTTKPRMYVPRVGLGRDFATPRAPHVRVVACGVTRKVIALARLRPRAKQSRTRSPCPPAPLASTSCFVRSFTASSPFAPAFWAEFAREQRCVRPTCAFHTFQTCTQCSGRQSIALRVASLRSMHSPFSRRRMRFGDRCRSKSGCSPDFARTGPR